MPTDIPLPQFVAGDPALDFVNTRYGMGSNEHDCLTDDVAVHTWLGLAGFSAGALPALPEGLCTLARSLREECKRLLEAARAGTSTSEPNVLNEVLEKGCPYRVVEWDKQANAFTVTDRPRNGQPESLLYPVATAMVALLTGDRLARVKECEAHDCVLLFTDTTKSGRRRWCSMATCGTRMKVAAFRSRKKEA
ncbi:CGNR zinc finger domain-containing protein [Pseudomonas sp. Marseille-QA0892]